MFRLEAKAIEQSVLALMRWVDGMGWCRQVALELVPVFGRCHSSGIA